MILDKIQQLCDGLEYREDPCEEAQQLAKDNNCIIVIGASDDLMETYGVHCELTENRGRGEFGCFDGTDFSELQKYIDDGDNYRDYRQLKKEIDSIGLKVFWYGEIEGTGIKQENYNYEEMGCFCYTVKDGIEYRDFKVYEDGKIYCTGKVIKMPESAEK